MPRPRGDDWLEDEVKRLELNGVQTIVSLLEFQEIAELGLECEKTFCLKHNVNFINYPIQDRGLPQERQSLNELIGKLRSKLYQGERIVIHCRMGIGRSSMIAAAVLIEDEMTANEIFGEISKIRGLTVPDTEDQVNWLKQFER